MLRYGVPADILERRPDLQASEARVRSAFFASEQARLAKLHGPRDEAQHQSAFEASLRSLCQAIGRSVAGGEATAGDRTGLPDEVLKTVLATMKKQPCDTSANGSRTRWVCTIIQSIELLLTLDLQQVTLFGQDWGGLIGLRLVALHPIRFSGVIAGNTALPGGPAVTIGPPSHPKPPGPTFAEWLEYSQTVPVFDSGAIGAQPTNLRLESATRHTTQAGAWSVPGTHIQFFLGDHTQRP